MAIKPIDQDLLAELDVLTGILVGAVDDLGAKLDLEAEWHRMATRCLVKDVETFTKTREIGHLNRRLPDCQELLHMSFLLPLFF